MSRRPLALVALAGLGLALLPQALSGAEAERLLRSAKEHLAAREYPQARSDLERLLREHAPDDRSAEALLLLGRAWLLEGQAQRALAAARRFPHEHSGSPLEPQARYLEARALLRLGRAEEAATLLAERLERLTSAEHRGGLAAAYLDLADGVYPDAEAPEEGADAGRALSAYERALAVGALGARHDDVLFRIARCQAALGRHADAARGFARLREEAPKSDLLARALLLEAEALLASGQEDAARARLRELEAEHPDTSEAALAVARLGDSYRPLDTPSEERRRLGVEHYERFLEAHPGHDEAPRVLYDLGRARVAGGRHQPAIAAFRDFVQRFPQHPLAYQASFAIGASFAAMGRHADARQAFAEYLAAYPSSEHFAAAQERIATSWIDQGEQAAAAERAEDALSAWRTFLESYPVHARAPGVQVRLGAYLLARGQVEPALTEWRAVSDRYPGRREGAQAHLALARTCEERLGDLARATREYQALIERFPRTPEAHSAGRALETLEEKHLRLLTPGARTSAQGPALNVAVRNVPELAFKAYRLDLLDTFRRKQQVGAVEGLALDIIAPDVTWTWKVEGYEPYRLYEEEVRLPLEGRGAWVVVAEEDTYRATTLVVVSDLTTVVKRAPGQVLVFALDRARDAPAAGVEVLVSDGGRVVAEGRTGEDGVLVLRDGALTRTYETRVFAHRPDGSVAFDGGRPGGRAGFGYTTKAYAFTDRPVYRPGQDVRFKAFLRRVTGGSYAFARGEEARVRVRDPRGVLVMDKPFAASAWGSIDGRVDLGQEPPLGAYALEVSYAGATFTATFHVEAYKKPEALVEVEAAEEGYLTGETVKARARVRTTYGAPVAAAPVRWWVYRAPHAFDRSVHEGFAWFRDQERSELPTASELVASGEGATDGEGDLDLAFPTEVRDEDQLYTVAVQARGPDGRPVQGALHVHVTTRGYYALVHAEARVVRPNEAFRVLVETVDARHQGRPAEGRLEVVRVTGRGEEVVATHDVTTDARGQGEVAGLRVSRPGDYVLRYAGADRRGGRVEGSDRVVVAGAAEDLAREAKVRADREVYRRGDVARVLLNAPAAGVWGLFTCEGEGVIDHRVLRLAERSQTLELELSDAYAPNVFLELAVPHAGELYTDADEVLVFKYLDVEVRSDREVYGPGDEVTLEVVARDQAGKPVAAELALAVVDEAIYAIRPDLTPGAKPFFYDQRRVDAVTTGSSLAWRYEGVTRRQLAELLAEREQRELAAKLEEERDARLGGMRSRRAERSRQQFGAGGRAAAPGAPPPPAPAAEPEADAFAFADAEGAAAPAQKKPGQAAAPAVRRRFADTALWAPAVVTGADGRARVTFRLPEDLTTWRITARGLSRETLAGDARGSFRTSQDLVASLALPRVVTDEDRYAAGLIVDNRTAEPLSGARARLVVDGQALPAQPFDLPARTARRFDFDGPVGGPGRRLVVGRAERGPQGDAIERAVEVRAAGIPLRRGASGLLETGATTVDLELPADVVPGTAELEVRFVPSAAAAVLDGLDYLDAFPYGCVEQTVSRFLPLLAAQELLARSGLPRDDLRRRLSAGAERGVRRLANLQRADGGWGWWGHGPADPYVTAYALLGLDAAREQGTFVDPGVLARARQACRQLLRAVGDDQEARALLLHALVAAGDGRAVDDDLNRAGRYLTSLSPQGLAHLLLARHGAGGGDVSGVAAALRSRAQRGPQGVWFPGAEGHGWCSGDAEGTGWAGLALARAAPADPLLPEVARWLRAQQGPGGAWRSTKATAAALLCLAAVEARRAEEIDARVRVVVDDRPLAVVRLAGDPGRAERVLKVPSERLPSGAFTVRLEKEGAGSPRFAVSLRAVRRAPLTAAGDLLRVERDVVAWEDPGRLQAFPGLASIVRGDAERSERARPVGELAVGERAWVEVVVTAAEELPYAVVEVPLPGGVEVVRDAVRGGCDRLEAHDDRVSFFLSRLPRGSHTVAFLVQAVTPGRFVALPATAELMYEPEVHGRTAGGVLEVLAAPRAEREPTPDERLLEARLRMEAGSDARARALFEALLPLDLVPQARREVLLGLLRLGLRGAAPRVAVAAFERLRDEDPRALGELTTAERRDVALAYGRAGEHRRASELALGVLVELFAGEVELVRTYRAWGQPLAGQAALRRMLLGYPDEDAIRQGWLALAQTYAQLPREGEAPRPRHWQPDGAADFMLEEAWEGFKDFCAWFPDDPRAAQAQAAACQALERLGDAEGVAAEAARFAARYPRDEQLDDVLLLRLRALTGLGRWDDAFAAGERILAYRERRGGRLAASPFQDEVLHTFARIHHQRGELEQAVAYYARVKDRIPDARDAWSFFTAEDLEVPDVVVRPTAEPAPEVSVRLKNVEELALKVYPVDLMILFLTRKDLSRIGDIDLTGVAPQEEREVTAERSYGWRERGVPLRGEAGEPGVSLVVWRAGDLERTTVVIRSDLRLEVQATPHGLRVYATMRDGSPAAGAKVRVTDGRRLVARGETDARGVFVPATEALRSARGYSVVAERDGHYALFREGR